MNIVLGGIIIGMIVFLSLVYIAVLGIMDDDD